MNPVYKTPEGESTVRAHYMDLLERWPAATKRHRVATREGETFVLECGPPGAPAVLLLHGTAATSAMWLPDVRAWSRHLRVFAVDIIGDAGLSAPSRPPMDSEAHALWLDDVFAGLSLPSASLVGISLGGWVALDYATRHPEWVEKLVVINPGGVGRPKNVLLWALPLLLLGGWGRRKMMEQIGGKPPAAPSPDHEAIGRFSELIFAHFRPRTASLPQFSDVALGRLAMPVMAILGGKDVFIDAPGTRRRLEGHAAKLTMRFLPEGRHFVPEQGPAIEAFLADAPNAAQ